MEIKHIQDHLMSVEEGYVRCFLIEGEPGALVIDGGVETGLRKFMEKQTSQKLTFLLTHSDPDHTAACGEFEEILLHPAEMARLARKQKIQNRFAAIQEGDLLDFEPYHFEVVLIPGHTPGSIALWEKEKRFLISGDSVTNATTFLFGEGRSLPAYLCSLRKLAAIAGQLNVIYGSHGPVEVPPTRINELIALCERVERGEIHGVPAERFAGDIQEYRHQGAAIYYPALTQE